MIPQSSVETKGLSVKLNLIQEMFFFFLFFLLICLAGVFFFFRSVGTALILSARVVSGSSLSGNARRQETP